MTNREKYITKRNEYDLLMTIRDYLEGGGTFCPIKAIGGKRVCEIDLIRHRDANGAVLEQHIERNCERCIQLFLNEESEE